MYIHINKTELSVCENNYIVFQVHIDIYTLLIYKYTF